jgi:hypothetical protein
LLVDERFLAHAVKIIIHTSSLMTSAFPHRIYPPIHELSIFVERPSAANAYVDLNSNRDGARQQHQDVVVPPRQPQILRPPRRANEVDTGCKFTDFVLNEIVMCWYPPQASFAEAEIIEMDVFDETMTVALAGSEVELSNVPPRHLKAILL